MNITHRLATYFVETSYEDIPEPVIHLAKRYIKDWLAAAVGGSGDKSGKVVVDYVRDTGGAPEARILGTGVKTSLPNAALVNGTFGHILDYDDSGPSHPTACILPAALAFGEKLNISGREFLLAQILGYECFNRLYQAAKEYELVLRRKGIHPTSVWGPSASATVSAKLLNLDVEQTKMALGIAASQSFGLMENFGTPTKGLHCGLAARAGVTAAQLVRLGYRATQTVYEGSHGFYHALMGQGHYYPERVDQDLGKNFLLLDPGIDTKLYPACAATLRGIEGSIKLARKYDIQPEAVASIHVLINATRRNFLRFDRPSCGDEAKFSMPYAVTIGIVDRDVTLDSFTTEKVNLPVVQELMKKVTLEVMDDALGDEIKKTSPITVTMTDGQVYKENIVDFTGTAACPMSDEEARKKFHYCASISDPLLPEERVDACIAMVDDLENLDNINDLMDTLVAP